jgi:hypothetical protein
MSTNNIQPPITDWGNNLYSDLGGIGTFFANFIMIAAIIIALVLIVLGMYTVMYNDDDKYVTVSGTVTSTDCVKSATSYNDRGQPSDSYKCNVIVDYEYDGKKYSQKMYLTGGNAYIKNEPINLKLEKSKPNNVQLSGMTATSIGYIMIICAFGMSGLAYLNYYLAHNYRVYAASSGVKGIFNIFRGW